MKKTKYNKEKMLKRILTLFIMISISLTVYCINLNRTINESNEKYSKLHNEYVSLAEEYNNQVKKIDDINVNHAVEIEELNKQSLQLVEKIDELTENINVLKSDLQKIKK